MNCGYGLPALGGLTSFLSTSTSKLDARAPTTIFMGDPFFTAPIMTSTGERAESTVPASIACTPSGAAGIT